jgi:AbrB family looped-hinge helix DNA binding protein
MDSKKGASCGQQDRETSCCRVEAVVSIDERGQMVLPKDMRERANIRAGDRLAIISCERDGNICCLALVKADEFNGAVKDMLGPIFRENL